jgi:DNA-binding transcriptional ArsR family regulator
MDAVFRALADPTRRGLLDSLHARDGQTLLELCVGIHMSRQSVSKHLGILEEAQLVTTVRQGRRKLHHLNAAPVADIGERWIHRFQRARIDLLTDLRRALEEPPMTTPDRTQFRYVAYIRTTPERLWQALSEPAFTIRWWQGTAIDSAWTPGAPMTWLLHGTTIAHPDQLVLVSDPPRRLSYTWHTFTPAWAEAIGFPEERRVALDAEPRSTVTFELEPRDDQVKLTVTHGELLADGRIIELITEGWPRVVSDLKSVVEADDVVDGG